MQREQCLSCVERSGWEIIGDDLTGDLVFLDVRSGLDAIAVLPLTKADIACASTLFAERTAQIPDLTTELSITRSQIERRLAKATTLVLDGTLSAPIYRQQREAMEAELTLDTELGRLWAPVRQTHAILHQLTDWLEHAGDVGAILANGDLDEKAAAIAGAVEQVIIRPSRNLELIWRPWAAALRG